MQVRDRDVVADLVAWNEFRVQEPQSLPRRHALAKLGADVAAEDGAVERRRDRLPGNVPDHDLKVLAVRVRIEVVQIPAHLLGRVILGGDLVALQLGTALRQDVALDLARDLELARQSLPLDQLPPELLVLDRQPARLEPPLDRHEQIGRVPWLDDVAIDVATVYRLHQHVDVGETGEDDADRVRERY